jgi:hypothetical protein
MDRETRSRADARLEAALRDQGLADPRAAYRACLRALREANHDAFERALRHYDEVVVPLLADGDEDPVQVWIDYGRFLGELLAPGRTVAVDGSGRAQPYAAPGPPLMLILHLPEDRGAPAIALCSPDQPTPPQQAAYDLLVLGRDALRS